MTIAGSSIPCSTSRTPSGMSYEVAIRWRPRVRSARPIANAITTPQIAPSSRASSAGCVVSMRSSVDAGASGERTTARGAAGALITIHPRSTVR